MAPKDSRNHLVSLFCVSYLLELAIRNYTAPPKWATSDVNLQTTSRIDSQSVYLLTRERVTENAVFFKDVVDRNHVWFTLEDTSKSSNTRALQQAA